MEGENREPALIVEVTCHAVARLMRASPGFLAKMSPWPAEAWREWHASFLPGWKASEIFGGGTGMETKRETDLPPRIKAGASRLADPGAAVDELARAIAQPECALVIVFASSRYDREQLATALSGHFPDSTVIGCTTAGEIGPLGYGEGGLSGLSFHRDDLAFELGLLPLSHFEVRATQMFAHALKESLHRRCPEMSAESMFALMLVDGLCGREEIVTRAFSEGLDGIPLVGGSAGDDFAFRQSWVLYEGSFVTDAALLLVAATPFAFEAFKTQHFVSGEDRLVVTGALPSQRVVTEINGCPAAEEYARTVGVDPEQLGPVIFAAFPVIVRIGNTDFVRSINQLNDDGSLKFFSAVEEGIVFRVARSVDMIDNLRQALAGVEQHIGLPAAIIGCDCGLRHLEARERNIREDVGELFVAHRVVGFSTYGEQYGSMHVNQTFTGLAIGQGRPA